MTHPGRIEPNELCDSGVSQITPHRHTVETWNTGNPAHIRFDDPDAIVLIETLRGRAGMALSTRDDYRRHPLLAAH